MYHVHDLVSVVARCFKSPDSVAEQPTTSNAKDFNFQKFSNFGKINMTELMTVCLPSLVCRWLEPDAVLWHLGRQMVLLHL